MMKRPTKKQREFLTTRGYKCPKTRQEAWQMIGEIITMWKAAHPIEAWQEGPDQDVWAMLHDEIHYGRE